MSGFKMTTVRNRNKYSRNWSDVALQRACLVFNLL